MGDYKLLQNTRLIGNMNDIGRAINCEIIGNMNDIDSMCPESTVSGDMNDVGSID